MPETPDQKLPKDLLEWMGIADAPRWSVARPLGPIIATALFLLFALALTATFVVVFRTIFADGAVTLGVGGLIAALLGAPFLIWGTALKHQTVRYQKEGHMTDRIAKAVEMLGAEKTVDRIGRPVVIRTYQDIEVYREPWVERTEIEWQGDRPSIARDETVSKEGKWQVFTETTPNLEVRIGAILSLERIAQDSTTHDKGRDHVRVMEILCAYVRNNSTAKNLEPTPSPFQRKLPRLDIQIVFDVLRKRNDQQIEIEKEAKFRLDLSGADLDGVDLSRGNFSGALFVRSRLEGAILDDAFFGGARFHYSLFAFPSLYRTHLRGTNFNRATIRDLGFGGFAVTAECCIFIEAAEVLDLDFVERNSGDFFGSRDTTVKFHYQNAHIAGAEIAQENEFLSHNPNDVSTVMDRLESRFDEAEIKRSRHFLHWNPYTIDDLAAGPFRARFRERNALVGWPFED